MAGATAQPVLGYPSKGAAIDALFLSGMKPNYIAIEVGTTPASVRSRIKEQRKLGLLPPGRRPGRKTIEVRAAIDAGRDTRGIWTPEKLEKARRLFGKTMLYIAEALQVPPKELLEYGLKGVLPPMGEGQRVAQLLEDRSQQTAEPQPIEQPVVPAPEQSPDRDDDEAELARLAALEDEDNADQRTKPQPVVSRADEKPAPAAPPRTPAAPDPGHEYYLTDEAGQWLHESLEALTKNRKYAWKGTTKKIALVLQRMPKWKVLVPERVPL